VIGVAKYLRVIW